MARNSSAPASGLSAELRAFASRVAASIVTLDIALYFQAHPSTVETPSGISLRVYGEAHDITEALAHLVEAGVLTRATLGAGAYPLYSLTEDRKVRRLLTRLSEAYHRNPQARTQIVRGIVTGWGQAQGG
jgi:hypothetical protein